LYTPLTFYPGFLSLARVNILKAIIVYPINLLSRISSYYRSMLDKKNKKYLPVVDPGFQVRGDLKKLR
jgi:hypothetical protein